MPRRHTSGRPVELARDHARPRTVPAPTTKQLETHLQLLLYPVAFGLRDRYRALGHRERILSLPVMVGILVTLVWRQIASISELQRVLARESLLWVEPTEISQQALSARLDALPAELFAQVWHDLVPALQQRAAQRPTAHAALLTEVAPHFDRVWILDSSRLEAVFKKSGALRGVSQTVLGGTLTTVLDLASHLPVHLWLDASPTKNDRRILDTVVPLVPERTILLLDRGFSRFSFFDALTETGSVLVSQWGNHWVYDDLQTLSSCATTTDQIVRVGKYRSSRCHHPVRRIGRKDAQGVWHYWITTELDPRRLPPRPGDCPECPALAHRRGVSAVQAAPEPELSVGQQRQCHCPAGLDHGAAVRGAGRSVRGGGHGAGGATGADFHGDALPQSVSLCRSGAAGRVPRLPCLGG